MLFYKDKNMSSKEVYIKVKKDGPYLVYGVKDISEKIIIADENGFCESYGDGRVFEIKSDPVELCRCGKSKNSPYCDDSHLSIGFVGCETASFEPILKNAEKYEGPNLTLMDNSAYCSYARFCDAHGEIWNLLTVGDEETDADAIREAKLCPSGRLIMFDKNGNLIEENLPKSIAVLEDKGLKISGPLWVRGGIRVESADGKSYEIRNRQTLCRCGASGNKPFCDCTHSHINYKAEYNKED